MAGSRRKSGPNSPQELDEEVLDVSESVLEELPAILVARIAQYYDSLRGVKIKSERAGAGWRLLKARLNLGTPPSDKTIDEIALLVCGMVLKDVDKNGPANNYHALLEVQIGDSTKTQDKYVPLQSLIDSEGTFGVYDNEGRGAANDSGDLRDSLEGFTDLAIRSLGAVVEATEGYAGLAKGLKDVFAAVTDNMRAVAQQGSTQVEMELRIKEMQVRQEGMYYEHKERMSKYEHMGDVLMTLAGPIGEQLSDFIQDNWDLGDLGTPGGAANGGDTSNKSSARSPGSRLARMLDTFLGGLDPEQLKAFKEIYSEDEWDCLESSRSADSDEAFCSLFRKIGELFQKRSLTTDGFQQAVLASVGVRHAMKLKRLWKELGKMGV